MLTEKQTVEVLINANVLESDTHYCVLSYAPNRAKNYFDGIAGKIYQSVPESTIMQFPYLCLKGEILTLVHFNKEGIDSSCLVSFNQNEIEKFTVKLGFLGMEKKLFFQFKDGSEWAAKVTFVVYRQLRNMLPRLQAKV